MGKYKHIIKVTVLTIISTVGLFFLFNWMFARPKVASAQAVPIDTMFRSHFITMAFLFSLIMVLMLYSVVVFRRRPGDTEDAPHIHGHTGLEIAWTVIPTIVVIGFGIYGTVVLGQITSKQDNEMVVSVTGQQWSWSFAYPDQNVKSTRLVLPVDQPILLELQSQDVLHSFWVPEFRVKQDLVPGQTKQLRLTPTKIGNYRLRCAEICGTGHSQMLADVQVVSQADFDQFITDASFRYSDLPPEERGQHFYTDLGCNGCHSIDGTAGAGPTWQGLYMSDIPMADGSTVVADDAYIRESILDPNAHIVQGFNANVMPQDFAQKIDALQAQISANEGANLDVIADLIAFMQTLNQ